MKAGDEIIIRLRAEESNDECYGCFYSLPYFGCLFDVKSNEDLPCKGEKIIFKQIKETPEKSR